MASNPASGATFDVPDGPLGHASIGLGRIAADVGHEDDVVESAEVVRGVDRLVGLTLVDVERRTRDSPAGQRLVQARARPRPIRARR